MCTHDPQQLSLFPDPTGSDAILIVLTRHGKSPRGMKHIAQASPPDAKPTYDDPNQLRLFEPATMKVSRAV